MVTLYPTNKTFSAIRLPLMAGVVIAHCNIAVEIPSSMISHHIIYFLSRQLTFMIIPTFYLMSGMLFFNNVEGNLESKLKRRVQSVLIPYLLWNLIALCTLFIKRFCFPTYFPQYEEITFSLPNLLKGFWSMGLLGEGFNDYPYDFVLWFIRNLLVAIPISALIYKLLGLRIWMLPLFFLYIYFFNDRTAENPYGLVEAFIYFYTGGIAQKCLKNFKTDNARLRKLIYILSSGLIIWIGWSLLEYISPLPINLTYIANLVACGGLFGVTALYVRLFQYHADNIWSKSLFFIFAAHGLWLSVAVKTGLSLFGPASNLGFMAAYFFIFLLLWFGDFLIYMIFNRIFPRAVNLLCGGRN